MTDDDFIEELLREAVAPLTEELAEQSEAVGVVMHVLSHLPRVQPAPDGTLNGPDEWHEKLLAIDHPQERAVWIAAIELARAVFRIRHSDGVL